MNVLNGTCYDPAAAVSKSTTALLAMTALDVVNLRLAITVPAHGMIRVRMAGTLHGATTCPQILLGVMNGSTVLKRCSPMHGATNIAATSQVKVEADFIVTGLTPGAMNVDAAYGVETAVASTGLKYGGPNNATANDAFGGFVFEIYDPQPLKVGLDGGVNATQWRGTALATPATAGIPKVAVEAAGDFAQAAADKIWATAARTLTANPGLDAAGVRTALGLAAANLDSQLTAIDDFLDSEIAAIKAKTDNLPASPAAVSDCITAAAVRAALGMAAANLDTQITALASAIATRLADADYTDPPTATEVRDAIFSRMVSQTLNFLQVVQLNSATLLGKNYGAGTLERGFRDLDDLLNAVVGTFDVVGPLRNRTSVIYDPPPAP